MTSFFECDQDGMYYTGHASALVRLSGQYIQFDPVVYSDPYGSNWVFYPRNNFDFDHNLLDAIVVSHLHQDHYDITFLQKMSGVTPIFVFDGRDAFIQDLKKNKIDFTLLKPFQNNTILNGVQIYGVLNRENGIDSSCMIYNENFKFYHGNDNYCYLKDLEDMVKITGSADLAAIPFAYINWYPQLLGSLSVEQKQAESDRLVRLYYQKFFDQAAALQARSVMPFGANLFPLIDAYSPSSLETKTPADLAEYVKSSALKTPYEFLELYATDFVLKKNKNIEVSKGYKFQNGKDFRNRFNQDLGSRFVTSLDDHITKVDPSFEFKDINIKGLNAKMHNIPSDIKEDFLIVSDGCSGAFCGLGYLSGFKEVKIFKRGEKHLGRKGIPMHKLVVPEGILQRYLKGEISIENIIGTRAFVMFRAPESYRPEVLKVMNTVL